MISGHLISDHLVTKVVYILEDVSSIDGGHFLGLHLPFFHLYSSIEYVDAVY